MKKKSLITILQEIMDLPKPLEEANKKLRNTFMVVNGKIAKISEFFLEDNCIAITNDYDSCTVSVESLEVWLPDAGLYQLGNGQLLLLNKTPKRQWAKSFTHDYYRIKVIGNPAFGKKKYKMSEDLYNDIRSKEALDITVDSTGDIYYLYKKVGEVFDSSSILCLTEEFEQELIDWSR